MTCVLSASTDEVKHTIIFTTLSNYLSLSGRCDLGTQDIGLVDTLSPYISPPNVQAQLLGWNSICDFSVHIYNWFISHFGILWQPSSQSATQLVWASRQHYFTRISHYNRSFTISEIQSEFSGIGNTNFKYMHYKKNFNHVISEHR